jgi:hypothetical protein
MAKPVTSMTSHDEKKREKQLLKALCEFSVEDLEDFHIDWFDGKEITGAVGLFGLYVEAKPFFEALGIVDEEDREGVRRHVDSASYHKKKLLCQLDEMVDAVNTECEADARICALVKARKEAGALADIGARIHRGLKRAADYLDNEYDEAIIDAHAKKTQFDTWFATWPEQGCVDLDIHPRPAKRQRKD